MMKFYIITSADAKDLIKSENGCEDKKMFEKIL